MGQLDKDQLAAGSVQLWSPHRALSGAKAPSFSLTRACTHAQTLTHIHTQRRAHANIQAWGRGLQKLAWWPWEDRMMLPHHLTQKLFSQLSVRQHSRYLSPFVQLQPSMWLSTPCWAQAAWTEATDVRQRAFRFWSCAVECNCLYSLAVVLQV